MSIAYSDDIWQNDMIFKDQDDCSKMLVCELNRMRRDGQDLTESELVIADAFGSGDELDVAKPSLAFDIAAVIGREVEYNCKGLYTTQFQMNQSHEFVEFKTRLR